MPSLWPLSVYLLVYLFGGLWSFRTQIVWFHFEFWNYYWEPKANPSQKSEVPVRASCSTSLALGGTVCSPPNCRTTARGLLLAVVQSTVSLSNACGLPFCWWSWLKRGRGNLEVSGSRGSCSPGEV